MAPNPGGTAACIAFPRVLNNKAVSFKEIDPAAHNAVYSPKECPAAYFASETLKPHSASSAFMAAIPQAINAGCALAVSVKSLISPCHINLDKF